MKKTLIGLALALISGSAAAQQCASIVNVELLSDDRAYIRVDANDVIGPGKRNLIGYDIGGEFRTFCNGAVDTDCCADLSETESVCDLPDVVGTVRFLALKSGQSGSLAPDQIACRYGVYVDIE